MPLLEPKTERIAPRAQPSDDRAPDSLAAGVAEPLASELRAIVGADGLLGRASDLIRYASDASPYRKLPQAVVRPRDVHQVAALMAHCRDRGLPLVFRSGGTSLNGQSQTDGVLADVRHHWGGIEVLDDEGLRVRVKPGAILGHVNRVLAPYGRKLGPDPASTDIATVGGVVANNSGGMRCGIVRDSYSTVSSLTFALPSGTVIDTADPEAASKFEAAEPELVAELARIRDELRADADLRERVRRKFEIKNTTGYRLCAFLDADEPVEIFRRLLIGSEGTLAFIAEVVFDTVPQPTVTTTAWAHFDSIKDATDPVGALVEAGATAVELMVAPALMVAANSIAGAPEYWKELPLESAALLIEFGAEDTEGLAKGEAAAAEVLEGRTFRDVEFSRDPERIEINWKVREGLHGLIGQFRAPGSALIVEDVCVPPAQIAEAAEDLRALLGEHGFLAGVAGHASAGNLHFMLTPDFGVPEDVERYEQFIAALVELILDRYDGSLKAEHGTGLNMAPFVEREWGRTATELMWRVKAQADPQTVLGPGVLLNRDPDCHLQDLKTTPEIEEVATKCVECGFCEPVCPSRGLTTTPRQRIVLRREMARQPEGSPLLAQLLEEYEYDALQTCAADSTCASACPLGIDTGKLVKGMRADEHTPREEKAALRAAQRWDKVESAARAGLKAGAAVSRAIGDAPLEGITAAARRAVSAELVPEWEPPMPPPAPSGMPPTVRHGAHAVYLPACVNRIFGRSPELGNGSEPGGAVAHSVPEALVTVSARAGKPVWIPGDVAGSCCSTPFASKGYRDAAAAMANGTVENLWRWCEGGELPVVIDASSCTHGLLESRDVLTEENQGHLDAMTILDSIEWAGRHLLTHLEIDSKIGTVVIHPTCSSKHLGLDAELALIAGTLAEEVITPEAATCCGFAGDRGFLHPELTASATREEAAEVVRADGDAHLCANRTCEIGLERATGERYESFVYLLERATR